MDEFKVMTWSEYTQQEWEDPYVYELSTQKVSLFYFGSAHSFDPRDKMFLDIDQSFDLFKPEVVLVGGVPALSPIADSELKEAYLTTLSKMNPQQAIENLGESAYVARRAQEKGIPVYSPEPDIDDETAFLLEDGFSKEDLFLYFMMREVEQFGRTRRGISLAEYMQEPLELFKQQTDWPDYDYSLDSLLEIANTTWGKKINPDKPEFPIHEIWPTKELAVTNDIARRSSDYRELNIIGWIEHFLSQYQRVFIIYGAPHAVRQRPALENLIKTNFS